MYELPGIIYAFDYIHTIAELARDGGGGAGVPLLCEEDCLTFRLKRVTVVAVVKVILVTEIKSLVIWSLRSSSVRPVQANVCL